MMPALTARKHHRGYSLVELMIGMLLGIMLIAGAVSVYLASKRSFVEVEQVAALSENARFAEQLIVDSLRHVGFLGETTAGRVDRAPDLNLAVVGDCSGLAGVYDFATDIFADVVDASNNAIGCIDDGVIGTDVLVIKHAVPQAYTDGPRGAKDPNNPTHNDGTIDSPTALSAQRTYIMTNNIRGLVFDGADPHPTIVTGGDVPDGVAWEYRFEVYYVRRPVAGSNRPPRLARKVLAWDGAAMAVLTEDVVEGVERLRFLFGVDTDGNGEVDTYENESGLSGAADWANVVSVELFMLLRGAEPDAQYTDTKSYVLANDPPYVPNDNVRRLLTQTSISLRNIKLIIRGGA